MPSLRNIIAWVPIVGAVSEFIREDLYLMDSRCEFRYFASAVWHGIWVYLLFWRNVCHLG
jgi:hypothetical protein